MTCKYKPCTNVNETADSVDNIYPNVNKRYCHQHLQVLEKILRYHPSIRKELS